MKEEKIKKKILTIKWFLSHTRKLPLFTMDIAAEGYVNPAGKFSKWYYKIDWYYQNILIISKHGMEDSYRDPKDDKRFFQYFSKHELEKKTLIKKASKEIDQRAKQLIGELKHLSKNLSAQELINLFIKIKDVYAHVGTALGITRPIGIYLEERNRKKDIQAFSRIRKIHGKNYGLIERNLDRVFSILAKKWKMDKELIHFLRADEIIKHLHPNSQPNKKELKDRKKCYLLYTTRKGTIILTGKDVFEVETKIRHRQPKLSSNNTILGTVVFSGHAKGVVKIVKSEDELKKIQKGDIIVSPMTQVSFTPYLKKVKAIITDEGGVTCHAAIISRELGIPCIIGTKIATRVLKDGDKVEVDAERGIVKKL
ncbi:MAG: PEP-utilizing enzyme [Patescibacteria group bacterium]